MLCDNRAYRVNCIVSGESFLHETLDRSDYWLKVRCDLVFHDRVKQGVHREVGKFDPFKTMVLFDKENSLLFVEFEPRFWFRRALGIVFFHGSSPVMV